MVSKFINRVNSHKSLFMLTCFVTWLSWISSGFAINEDEDLPQMGLPTVQSIISAARGDLWPWARSGEVIWKRTEAEYALKKYRAWISWKSSSPEPLEVLQDRAALRRILITAIEREVIVRELKRRQGGVSIPRESLKAWLIQLIPGSLRPTEGGLEQFIRGRLRMNSTPSLDFFWEAAEDAYRVNMLLEQLLDEMSEEVGRENWRLRGELIKVVMLHIPRVPTSHEITEATTRLQTEMAEFYENNQPLFSQPLRLLVEPFWIRGGKLDRERKQAEQARQRFAGGEAIEDIIESLPMVTRGGAKTLRGRSIPKDTQLEEGSITPVRLTRYGWTFYRVQRVYPEYVRPLTEQSVQREVSAAVLRERDELPHAQALAQQARELLKSEQRQDQIEAWAKSKRIKLTTPAPFFSSTQQVVPSVGLAPELHDRLLSASVGEVLEPIQVRQHYVVATVKERQSRTGSWEEARVSFMEQWRQERRASLVNEWLTKHLENQPRWVSLRQLSLFDIEGVRFEADPSGNQKDEK